MSDSKAREREIRERAEKMVTEVRRQAEPHRKESYPAYCAVMLCDATSNLLSRLSELETENESLRELLADLRHLLVQEHGIDGKVMGTAVEREVGEIDDALPRENVE